MGYLYLSIAIILEVIGTTCMKLAEGFTRPVPSVLVFVFYLISLAFMILAVKTVDISVVYAIWAGLGTALIAGIGMFWFKEPVTTLKIASILIIIAGVTGLHLSSTGS